MFFGDHGEEQNNTYAAIKTTSKHFVSRSIVAKLYTNARAASHWVERVHEVGWESRVAIKSSCISGPISDAWQLIALLLTLLCSGIYERFDFNESYFPFFVPKLLTQLSFMHVRC